MRPTPEESKERYQRVKAAFDQLAASPLPVTATDLAEQTGLGLFVIHRILIRCPWWTPALASAARQEQYRRLHEKTAARGFPGVAAMQAVLQNRSQTRTRTLFDAYNALAAQAVVVTPGDLATVLGMNIPNVKRRLAQAEWWSPERARAAESEGARRRRRTRQESEAHRAVISSLANSFAPPRRHILHPEQVVDIRKRLQQGDSPTKLAGQFGKHLNAIFDIQRNRTWRHLTEEQAGQDEAPPSSVVLIEVGEPGEVILPPRLLQALHTPKRVHFLRRARDRAPVLVPSRAGGGYPVSSGAPPRIALPSNILEELDLTEGAYRWALLDKQVALRLSDVPEPHSSDFITTAEACKILNISRQAFSRHVAAGHFQVHYDTVQGRQVVLRSAVQARKA